MNEPIKVELYIPDQKDDLIEYLAFIQAVFWGFYGFSIPIDPNNKFLKMYIKKCKGEGHERVDREGEKGSGIHSETHL